MKAQRKFEILSAVSYLHPDKDSMTNAETFDINYLIKQVDA